MTDNIQGGHWTYWVINVFVGVVQYVHYVQEHDIVAN